MVCLGNICRSPLAEGIMTELSQSRGLDWKVDSAGTGSWHIGEPPDPRSQSVATLHGIDISGQRARKFHYSDFEQFDLIFAMDRSNFSDIIAQAEGSKEREKVRLILEEAGISGIKDVPDPYWNDNGFEHVYQMLHEACGNIIEKIVKREA